MSGSEAALFEALLATWPPEELSRCGAVTLRRAAGGGRRVRAAFMDGQPEGSDIAEATRRMRDWGQAPLFFVPDRAEALDQHLAGEGWSAHDDTVLYQIAAATLAARSRPRLSTFPVWPPLAVMDEIWQAGGIDAHRRAVMTRADAPKTALLGRLGDRPAGAAFLALRGGLAVLHALEVKQALRRQGLGAHMLTAAGQWAAAQDATSLVLAVSADNGPARALYEAAGMRVAARYHYRSLAERP